MPYEKFQDGTKKDLSEEAPFDIPDSWAWVRLGNVFQHNTGKALNRSNVEGAMYEYITTSNVYWDEFKLDDLRQMPFTIEELEKCALRKGDLLVCEGGDIGRSAIWNFDRSVCIQNHLHRLRPFVEICVPYFYFVLRMYKASNRIQGNGIGLQGFSSGRVHNLLVPLPPLAEQKRIVSKVEELFAYADKMGAAADGLEKAAQRLDKKILDLAIRGKLVPQDPTDEPASELLKRVAAERKALVKAGKLKASKSDSIIFRGSDRLAYETRNGETVCIQDEIPFDIPDSWAWTRLGSVISLLSGRDLEPSEYSASQKRFPYMTGASNFAAGRLIINRWTDKSATISHVGDLLITCKGTIGAMAFNTVGDIHIARQIMAISSPWISLEYVKVFLESIVISLRCAASSMIPGIDRNTMLNLLVPLPPHAEQKRIVAKVNEMRVLLDELKIKSASNAI